MLWIWSYSVTRKELLLKLAVPKKQTKSLKTMCDKLIAFAGCRDEILLKITLSQNIFRGFSKTCIQSSCMWNINKTNNLNFSMFLLSSVYYSSRCMSSNVRSTFVIWAPPNGCFSLCMSECYIQINQVKS